MAADWIGIDSSYLHSFCGETIQRELSDALDGFWWYWGHGVEETHWFILDLSVSYTITKVKSYSKTSDDPIDVNIYVSDSLDDFGDPVVEGISTWQDTDSYVEIETTEKAGRYVKVEIEECEVGAGGITWGSSATNNPIFDIYGEAVTVIEISGDIAGASSLSVVEEVVKDSLPVDDRPPDYDPEKTYDEATGTWVTVEVTGGERYKSNLVIVGQNDSGEGVIYYG